MLYIKPKYEYISNLGIIRIKLLLDVSDDILIKKIDTRIHTILELYKSHKFLINIFIAVLIKCLILEVKA